MNILVTTVGTSWAIVPELLGFTNPGLVDLFCNHEDAEDIGELRVEYGIEPVDEVWILTTYGESTVGALDRLEVWHGGLRNAPELRVWYPEGVSDLASAEECHRMADLIYRTVFNASERCRDGKLLLSLAGGRKTMSADMQQASSVFGCHALLHVVNKPDRPPNSNEPDFFYRPFSGKYASWISPLVTAGRTESSAVPFVDPPLSVLDFPLLDAGSSPVRAPASADFYDEIHHRLEQARDLFFNYTVSIRDETATNFRKLYALPPGALSRLRDRRIGIDPARTEEELSWLRGLPKAELHCHLGGIADVSEMIEIAAANADGVSRYRKAVPEFDAWLSRIGEAIGAVDLAGLRRVFKAKAENACDLRTAFDRIPEPFAVAGFLMLFKTGLEKDLLDRFIFGEHLDEERFCGIGFRQYEPLGDFQGSGLLQSAESIATACDVLKRQAERNNIRYFELRCSPVKYTRGDLNERQVVNILTENLRENSCKCHFETIFTGSRHGTMSEIYRHIELAQELLEKDFEMAPAGFDLAGDESARNPGLLRQAFLPLMRHCIGLSVHAGEKQPVESIWEAVYHLKADRIGHGLTLRDNQELMEHFRNRRIVLEMCPSSNCQIAGYADNFLSSSDRFGDYPLKEYLEKGLRVTVNTDNPGISRTDLTNELHRAARLSREGLSYWEILQLVRNSFRSAFAPFALRRKLLLEAEEEICRRIRDFGKDIS